MIFNEWTYAVFLLTAVAGFAAAPTRLRAHWIALIGALFYAFYGGAWIVVFLVEIVISRFYVPRGKIALLGITQAVLILAVVKYGAFFANGAMQIAGKLGYPVHAPVSQFPLPLGLSFFIFEFIHYAADRYRGRAPNVPQATYASFILFFPTMIAGPIKRVQSYVTSLAEARVNAADLWLGARRIAVGLVKKAVVADNINVFLENAFEPNVPHAARYLTLGFNMVLYSFRIYIDFSSYSDIAIGSARLFGIYVPENFNWPYLARNPSEFWRRWHISLSKWITDYIFVPLGGSRAGQGRIALNVLIAMSLSGLWHGAAANFVVWGVYHALFLIAYRLAVPVWTARVPEGVRESAIAKTGYVVLNYAGVVFGWIFFAMPLPVATGYAARLLGFEW